MSYDRDGRINGIVMTENTAEITVSLGIEANLRERAAHLYDIALGEKLALAIPDVIDTNPGARRLYERLGFHEEKTERFEFP